MSRAAGLRCTGRCGHPHCDDRVLLSRELVNDYLRKPPHPCVHSIRTRYHLPDQHDVGSESVPTARSLLFLKQSLSVGDDLRANASVARCTRIACSHIIVFRSPSATAVMDPMPMPALAERAPLLGDTADRQSADDYNRSSYTNQPPHQPYPYPHPLSASSAASASASSSSSSSYQSAPYFVPTSPFSPCPRRPAVQAAACNDVRRNLFTFLTAHPQLCLGLTFVLPQIMAIAFVLVTHWDTETCDRPLHMWASVYGVRLSLSLIFSVLRYLPPRVSNSSYVVAMWPCVNELLYVFSFVWFILGNYWLFHAIDCQSTAPAVFQLVSVLLVFNCVLLFLPLFMFLLCCPFLYFCGPPVMRLVIAEPPP